MTIDVGYAHLALDDGTELDFVDVPGHDRLVGNMLVGAGEIDAALLVVAADDGPRAQTLEHLALLDALGIRHGLAVVTKADVAGPRPDDGGRGAPSSGCWRRRRSPARRSSRPRRSTVAGSTRSGRRSRFCAIVRSPTRPPVMRRGRRGWRSTACSRSRAVGPS